MLGLKLNHVSKRGPSSGLMKVKQMRWNKYDPSSTSLSRRYNTLRFFLTCVSRRNSNAIIFLIAVFNSNSNFMFLNICFSVVTGKGTCNNDKLIYVKWKGLGIQGVGRVTQQQHYEQHDKSCKPVKNGVKTRWHHGTTGSLWGESTGDWWIPLTKDH